MATLNLEVALQQLEEASNALLAPPNLVTEEQRHVAETVFLEFQKLAHPYDACQYILEHSKVEYAQFQAAATIKCSVVREWAVLDSEKVELLRTFLLHHVISHPSLQNFVREEIFQTLSVIVKRGVLTETDAARERIFSEITQLIGSGQLNMQLIACSLLTALLNEFSSHTKSSGAGFTWELHMRCKRKFENTYLLQTMHFALQVLNELAKCPSPYESGQLPVVMRFLSIAEQILNWEFLPTRLTRRHMVPFGSLNQSAFKPAASWRETIFNPEMLSLFFKMYSKAHYNSELCHHAMQCLVQLSSLNGPVVDSDASELNYFSHFIQQLITTTNSLQLETYDVLGLATICENIVRWFKMDLLARLPPSIIQEFTLLMTRLTTDFSKAAILGDLQDSDDNVFGEALEKMLYSWTALVQDGDGHFPKGQFKAQATQIFNVYVESHLTNGGGGGGDTYEVEEEDEPDRVTFAEQLTSIGILAREIPEHSLPTLSRLVEEKVRSLKAELASLKAALQSGQHETSINPSCLSPYYDDLHWLIMISSWTMVHLKPLRFVSGFHKLLIFCLNLRQQEPMLRLLLRLTSDRRILLKEGLAKPWKVRFAIPHTSVWSLSCVLTEDVDGEEPLIPTPILNYSISQSAQIDQSATCVLLVTPDSPSTAKTDDTIKLLSSVLQLLTIDTDLATFLSPLLDQTVTWFLKRFLLAYLAPNEEYYSQLSITLQSLLGAGTPGSAHFVNFLLAKVKVNLSMWSSEQEVVDDTLEMLTELVAKRIRCDCVVKCDSFWSLMNAVSQNEFPFSALSASSKRHLYKAIVYAGSALTENRQEFWDRMVRKPLMEFTNFVNTETFPRSKDEPAVRESLLHGLEALIGCCKATRVHNQSMLFGLLEPAIQATNRVLDVCHSYELIVQLCLEVFQQVVLSMICCLDTQSSERLYELCLAAIHTYAKYNTGVRTVEPGAEEDKYRDIILILHILANLMSKDLVDFGLNSEEYQAGSGVSATEIVLFGLTVIVPLMDTSLLQFPTLCSQYYKLLSFVAEIRPDKVLELSPVLLQMIMGSIQLSLSSFGSDISKVGLEFLTEMGTYIAQKKDQNLAEIAKMDAFIQPLLSTMLFEVFDVDLLDTMSAALYYLAVIYTPCYLQLQAAILEQQKDESHIHLLKAGFNALAEQVQNTQSNRKCKLQFIESMNKFLLEVKGFLCLR